MATVSMETLIERIHASPMRLALAATGGGISAVYRLLTTPGASRTVIEAIVPYSADALDDFLGGTPDQYCSEPTARAMAMAAFLRANRLESENARTLMGVGCSASLVSDRPKRGAHRVHVAIQTATSTWTASLEFEKGARNREEEEAICGALILNQIAAASQRIGAAPLGELDYALRPKEQISIDSVSAEESWSQLLLGEAPLVDSTLDKTAPSNLIFPGAFNPLHEGHRQMIEVATRMYGEPIALEISLTNVDKPPLDFLEIHRRLKEIDDPPVWLTRAPTFAEKARVFPGATFVVGADTIQRVGDRAYYGADARRMEQAIDQIATAGCRFLVFGRLIGEEFCEIEELSLPDGLKTLCDEVPETDFRVDVSSTNLRAQSQ